MLLNINLPLVKELIGNSNSVGFQVERTKENVKGRKYEVSDILT